MKTHCSHPNCIKQTRIRVTLIQGVFKYSIAVCADHGEWATSYLEEHVPQDTQNEEAEERELTNGRCDIPS